MPESKQLFPEFEDAPHIELNQNGASIDLSNWALPANRNWSYRNSETIFPFVTKISRGTGAVHELKDNKKDISAVTVQYKNREMQLEEYLYESHADGFIVLQGDDIIYESYPRMEPTDRHLLQSVSKTTVSSIVGGLVNDGLIDLEKTVGSYIPEMTGYKNERLQSLMDMNVPMDFSEDFADPDAHIYEYEMITGWHPERGNQAAGMLAYLHAVQRDDNLEVGGDMHYKCTNTDTMVCIAESVTEKPFTELFEENIYSHIGAEMDAYFSTDAKGTAVGSGGWIVGLRDLARYGQIFANMGRANDGTQVIPESWVKEYMDPTKGSDPHLGDGWRYHNQMASNGRGVAHTGMGGQIMYACPETKVVVVQLSTTSAPSNSDVDTVVAQYTIVEAINTALAPKA